MPKLISSLKGGVVSLEPKKPLRGKILLSYTTLPFLGKKRVLGGHTNQWECIEIANSFLEKGYAVDVIDSTNNTFEPKHDYSYFIDVHSNLDRIAPLLNSDCIKILHATTSHWVFQNYAEYERLLALQKRRGVSLLPRRQLPPSQSVEIADEITLLGNEITETTYSYVKKSLTRIPLSTTHEFPSPKDKDFEKAQKSFLWLGGVGMVHKGLDLVLEAFASMPEYNLIICGKVKNESDFTTVYHKELFGLSNIKVVGLVDPGSQSFEEIRQSTIALLYPSCSEGQAGSVVTCMHAGLIPVVSIHSGVDVHEFGTILKENSVEEVKEAVRTLASSSTDEIRQRSIASWEYARKHHTKEIFGVEYRKFVEYLEKKYHSS